MNKLFILLPVYNRKKITEDFIKCLVRQTFQNYHLVLIDDGSIDGTAESVMKMVPKERLTIIQGKGNWWWAGSLQKGYKWLVSNSKLVKEKDFVLIINDDTAIDDDFLRLGIEIITVTENSLLLAQCYDDSTKELIDAGFYIDWRTLDIRKVRGEEQINCLSTRGLFLRVKDFYKIGGFFPKLLPHYLSDYEFTIRAYRKGFKFITDSRLKLYSNENTTGHRSQKEKNLFVFLKTIFLKRNTYNPIYWITFILLACPLKFKFKHISKIIFGFMKNLFYHLMISLK